MTASLEYSLTVNEYIAGAAGGIAGMMIGHPFDTVKLQLQIRATGNNKFTRTIDVMCGIASQGLRKGLFRGMLFPVASHGLVNSMFFGVYGNTIRLLQPDHTVRPTNSQVYVAGCVAGAFQLIIACPGEVIKCTLQSQIPLTKRKISTRQDSSIHNWPLTTKTFYKGPFECMKQIYKHEGIKGFYRGIFAMFIRDFPSYGLYLLCYELLHTYISSQSYSDKNGIIAALVAGGAAGCISWVSIMPADVIKSRIQVDHIGRYKGFWDCAYLTVKRGGFMMLYRGTFITILRAFPVNGVTFLVYTEVVKRLNFLNPPLSMQSVQTIRESDSQD